MRNKVYKFLSGLVCWSYFVVAFIIFLVILLSNISYSAQKIFSRSNFILLIYGILLTLVLFILFSFIKEKKDPINVLTTILFLVQTYVAFNIYMGPQEWDEGRLIRNAMSASIGDIGALDHDYFSFFPNNQMLLFIDSTLFKLNSKIGIFDTDNGLLFIILLQCFLSAIGGKWLYEIISDETHTFRSAITGWLAYVMLIGLSGWNIIIYSDPMALVFPTAVLRLYQLTKKDRNWFYIRWFFIAALSYIGFKIKPTAIIAFIAILGIEIIGFIKKIDHTKIVRSAKTVAAVAAALFLSWSLSSVAIKSTGLKIDPNMDTGPLHMIMMGLNPVNDGIWLNDDVTFSTSFPDKASRTEGQIKVIEQRLHNYGVEGLIKHQWKRTLTTFTDGTFAWGNEGDFYATIYPEKNSLVSPFLRNVFYNNGQYFTKWSSLQQMTWLTVFFLSLGIIFINRNKVTQVVELSLFGTILFNEIFEARARYLYLYIPFFIIAAAISCEKVCVECEGRLKVHPAGKFDKVSGLLEKYKDVIPYAVFGVLTTLVNIISYWICAHPLGMPVMVSTVIAWILAVLFAYLTNRKWVFHSEADNSKAVLKEIGLFFAARLGTGVIDWASMFIFVDLMSFNDVVIKTLANIVVIILNYIASKFLIFKHNR